MSRLKIRKKNKNKRTPNPDLAPDAPCWCGSGVEYAKCHALYDQIYSVSKSKSKPPDCPT